MLSTMREIARTLWRNTRMTAAGGFKKMSLKYWKKDKFSTYASAKQSKKAKPSVIVLFVSFTPSLPDLQSTL